MGIGIKVTLKKDFPVIKETLERMGIVDIKRRIIYPSCYCIETGEMDGDEKVYTVAHFKELFAFQKKTSDFEENGTDKARLRTIVYFLNKWNLVSVVNRNEISEILHQKIDVISKSEKQKYKVVHKFNLYTLDLDALKNEIA
jgi:hypothetical protein